MSKWNYETKSPNPTYIHNGNHLKLDTIIEDLKLKELKKILNPLNFIKLNKLKPKSKIQKIKDLFKSFFNI